MTQNNLIAFAISIGSMLLALIIFSITLLKLKDNSRNSAIPSPKTINPDHTFKLNTKTITTYNDPQPTECPDKLIKGGGKSKFRI